MIPALVALGALCACAPGIQAQRSDTIVRLAGKPVHSGVATLVEEITIGVTSGAEEYMFGEIADVAVGRDGSVFIYDRQVPAVRQYDVSGEYLRTFGHAGQGPGEYRAVSGIGVLPDGRVLIWDTSGWRINVYAATGELLESWRTPSGMSAGGVASSARAMIVDTAGIIWLRRRGAIDRERLTSRPELYERRRSDGTVIDSIGRPPFPRAELTLSATDPSGRARRSVDVPFSAPLVWRVSPLGHLVTAIPERYAFELLIPGAMSPAPSPNAWQPGQSIVSVRRDVKPEPVTRHERDSARTEVIEGMRRLDRGWSWSGPDIPSTRPLYRDLAIGMDGRIWVPIVPEVTPRLGTISGPGRVGVGPAGPPPAMTRREPPKPRAALYDVFEPSGTYLGQVQVPPRTSVAASRGDQLWAVVYDEDDVARLKRYRITWR